MSSTLIQQKSASSSRASSVASNVDSLGVATSTRQAKQVKAVTSTGLTYDTIRDKVSSTMKRDKNGRIVGNASVKALVDMFDACHKEGFDTRHFVPMLRQICYLVATGAKIPELYDEVSVDNGLVVVLDEREREQYDRRRDQVIDHVVRLTGLTRDNKILEFGRADKSGNKESHSPEDFVRDVLASLEMDMSSKAHRHGPVRHDDILSDAIRSLGLKQGHYSFKALVCVLKMALKNQPDVRLSISKESNPGAFDKINRNRKLKKGTLNEPSDKKEMNTLSYTVIRANAPGIAGALHAKLSSGRGEGIAKLREQSKKTMEELEGTRLVNSGDFVFNVVAEDRIALALASGENPTTNIRKLSVDEFVSSTQVYLHFESEKLIKDKEKQLAKKNKTVVPTRARGLFTDPMTGVPAQSSTSGSTGGSMLSKKPVSAEPSSKVSNPQRGGLFGPARDGAKKSSSGSLSPSPQRD